MSGGLTLFPSSAPVDASAGAVPLAARVRFWIGAVSLFAVVLVGALAVWAVVPGLLQPWNTSVVMSGSMEPRIRTGDAVVWRTDPADPLPENAVVVYSQGERTVIHRVIDHPTPDTYVAKGDANRSADSDPVRIEQVQGVGQLLVPIIGLPAVWWSEGRPLLVFLVGALVVAAIWTSHRTWDPDHDPWRDELSFDLPGTRDRDALLVHSSRSRSRSRSRSVPVPSSDPDDVAPTPSDGGGLLPPHVRAALLGR